MSRGIVSISEGTKMKFKCVDKATKCPECDKGYLIRGAGSHWRDEKENVLHPRHDCTHCKSAFIEDKEL